MMTLAGIEIDERDLIARVLSNLHPRRGERKAPRWALVTHTFGVGSGVARDLCKKFGFDPDEEISK